MILKYNYLINMIIKWVNLDQICILQVNEKIIYLLNELCMSIQI